MQGVRAHVVRAGAGASLGGGLQGAAGRVRAGACGCAGEGVCRHMSPLCPCVCAGVRVNRNRKGIS